jgi:hypothetical protein
MIEVVDYPQLPFRLFPGLDSVRAIQQHLADMQTESTQWSDKRIATTFPDGS